MLLKLKIGDVVLKLDEKYDQRFVKGVVVDIDDVLKKYQSIRKFLV